MNHLQRNHLVWLNQPAWDRIAAQGWDLDARGVLALWQQRHLPLVVGRTRGGLATGDISLGLPAPKAWGCRKLALAAPERCVTVSGLFPTLLQVARARRWPRTLETFALAMSARQVRVHVFGSHGWQFLTGLPYAHAQSDIDLSLHVDDLDCALDVARQLHALASGQRLDGEIVFPSGRAIAWRELHQVACGTTRQVMLKDRLGATLADLDTLPALLRRQQRDVAGLRATLA